MGKVDIEITSGEWNHYYDTAAVFASGGKNYLFAQTDSGKRWFISELTNDGQALKTELAHGEWNNYYGTAVVFTSNKRNYLFAHTDSGNRWFISELTTNGEGLKTELAHGEWGNYYGSVAVFESGGMNYLFAQTDSGDRWFTSKLTIDGEGFETELAHGEWNSYYGTVVAFVSDKKNYLFAQSDSGNRWFISELTADAACLKTELAHGEWSNYYGTAVAIVAGGKNCLFAQTNPTIDANRWFISELTTDGEGFKVELAHGEWNNYYGTIATFESDKKNYLFAQTDSGDRWFISELAVPSFDLQKINLELASGEWNNYYHSAVVFVEGDKSYLFAQTNSRSRRWFISELTPDGNGLLTELASGEWGNYYGTLEVFVEGEKNYLFAQADRKEPDNVHWFISELTPDGTGLQTVLAQGTFGCDTAISFCSDKKNYLFTQVSSYENTWGISELTSDGSHLQFPDGQRAVTVETAGGSWNNYYRTAAAFTSGGKNYLFAQAHPAVAANRWFISELTSDGIGMQTELSNGEWDNYYRTAVVFRSDEKSYLFAQTDSFSNRWFISELTPDGTGLETELAHGKWSTFYRTAVVFRSGGKNYLFAQANNLSNRWFISELEAPSIAVVS